MPLVLHVDNLVYLGELPFCSPSQYSLHVNLLVQYCNSIVEKLTPGHVGYFSVVHVRNDHRKYACD